MKSLRDFHWLGFWFFLHLTCITDDMVRIPFSEINFGARVTPLSCLVPSYNREPERKLKKYAGIEPRPSAWKIAWTGYHLRLDELCYLVHFSSVWGINWVWMLGHPLPYSWSSNSITEVILKLRKEVVVAQALVWRPLGARVFLLIIESKFGSGSLGGNCFRSVIG